MTTASRNQVLSIDPASTSKKVTRAAKRRNATASQCNRTDRSSRSKATNGTPAPGVETLPTGIEGLDLVLGGGLPTGRAMLVVGSAGSGKTILGTEFLCRGAVQYDDPGVLVSFEESVDELCKNAAGFGWDIDALKRDGKVYPLQIDLGLTGTGTETGNFDLEPLLVRIGTAIDRVGAKRILIDGINNLLSSFANERIVRTELLRLLRWVKDKGLTVVVTGEAGEEGWTRLGFEEYLADGLIVLDHRVEGKVAKRLLRVIKCRGLSHGTDEYPFLIGAHGISLFPIRAADLDYQASTAVVPTGVKGLDEMLGPHGVYKGNSILVSGSAGTGKSTLAASFCNAACQRGERAIYFALEESPSHIIRNMRSIGIDLERWRKKGLLTFHATRSMQQGIEGHLTQMQEAVRQARPTVAVIDPISSLLHVGNEMEVKSMMTRVTDFFRSQGITTLMTNLAQGGASGEAADFAVSSMADTWILVRVIEHNAERNNVIQVLKSRGMEHSRLVREFNFTKKGLAIVDAYIGLDGVVIGSARHAAEARDRLHQVEREAEIEQMREKLRERGHALEARIVALKAENQAEEEALRAAIEAHERQKSVTAEAVEAVVEERNLDGRGD